MTGVLINGEETERERETAGGWRVKMEAEIGVMSP